jgi:hypothetical protein
LVLNKKLIFLYLRISNIKKEINRNIAISDSSGPVTKKNGKENIKKEKKLL